MAYTKVLYSIRHLLKIFQTYYLTLYILSSKFGYQKQLLLGTNRPLLVKHFPNTMRPTFSRHPCTTIETTRVGLVAAGYGCGSIRMFDPSAKVTDGDAEDQLPVIVQVSAHARCVTSMSSAKEADLLLTVSEDSWIRIWRVTSGVIIM